MVFLRDPCTLEVADKQYRLHILKTVEPFYSAVETRVKNFEIRYYDRDFRVGDILVLIKHIPEQNKTLIDSVLFREITYSLTDALYPALPESYIILSLRDYDNLDLLVAVTERLKGCML
ncbi:hypothetical protein D3C71_1141310 [compost metagenome]